MDPGRLNLSLSFLESSPDRRLELQTVRLRLGTLVKSPRHPHQALALCRVADAQRYGRDDVVLGLELRPHCHSRSRLDH